MKIVKRILPIVAVLLMHKQVFALGAEQSGELGSPDWPKELNEMINLPNRVYSYFVNAIDLFYYAGDTDALNDFLDRYSKVPGIEPKLAIQEGELEIKSPFDKDKPVIKKAGWMLTTNSWSSATRPANGKWVPKTSVAIYPGKTIDMSKVKIPDNVKTTMSDLVLPATQPAKE